MKYLILALLALAAVNAHHLELNEAQRERVRGFAGECREKEGITADEVKAIRDGHFDNVTEKEKCFVNCFLEKLGFVVDGQAQQEVVAAKLTPLVGAEKVAAIAEKCNGLNADSTDHCERSFGLYQCYHQQHTAVL